MAEPIKQSPMALDRFGIVEVFATHLELSLEHSHPEQAARAAYAAVEAYLKSYSYIEVGRKESDAPEYQMVRKKSGGGGERM